MSKLTFEMPDMDVTLLAAANDIVQSSIVESLPPYSNPNIGPWVPNPGQK